MSPLVEALPSLLPYTDAIHDLPCLYSCSSFNDSSGMKALEQVKGGVGRMRGCMEGLKGGEKVAGKGGQAHVPYRRGR